jgi:hypothetical protein
VTAVIVYVLVACNLAAAALGHQPHAARAARSVAVWALRRVQRGSRVAGAPRRPAHARVRPTPSWAITQPLDYEEAA